MIKAVEFPNKEFATKEELFKELVANQDLIIDRKKSEIYKSVEKGHLSVLSLEISDEAQKGIFGAKEDFVYPIISTTRYKDSHNDVHFDGCFAKTCKDQQGKVHYALDHELKWDSIIAWKEDVKMQVRKIDWAMVGKSYSGQTEALIFEIPKDKFKRKDVLEAILSKNHAFENSIRMIYVKIQLGVNSQSKEYAEQKVYYDSRINDIANKEEVDALGYFWGVEELKIWKEGSLVVAGGSNDATSIYTKEDEPSEDTQKDNHESTIDKDFLEKELKKQFSNLKN
jgi:hypothetical protein